MPKAKQQAAEPTEEPGAEGIEADAYHRLYRPNEFDQVMGQETVIKAVQHAVENRTTKCFLFYGPPGTGKTTLARITAAAVGCVGPTNVIEVPAAKYTGVDDMRKLMDGIIYPAFGEFKNKAIILDEAHRLSKAAWESLLKETEEPPAHVYWFICTTEVDKIPKAIRQRFQGYATKPVPDETIEFLVTHVVNDQGLQVSDGIVQLVVREARGSPRQALVNLAKVASAETRQEAAELLRTVIEDDDATIELCRFLLKGGSWGACMAIVDRIDDGNVNAESVRIVVCNYMSKVAKNAKNERDAAHTLSILEAFKDEYRSYENLAPLMISLGRVIFPG